MRRILLLGLVVVALMAQSSASVSRVRIVDAPSFVFEGDVMTMQIRVEPHPQNRLLLVGAHDADCDCFVRLSREQLNGDTAPRTRWIQWRIATPGAFTIIAAAYSQTGEIGRDHRLLTVLARQ